VDATLLALAGLKRLGLADRATAILEIDDFLPAVGQGAIAVTVRAGDHQTRVALAGVLDAATGFALTAERAFLAVLDGSCRTPIAGHARLTGATLDLRGMVLRSDGSQTWETRESGPAEEAARIGATAGHALLDRLPAGVLP
jgi:hydroxymethylbilane synthase